MGDEVDVKVEVDVEAQNSKKRECDLPESSHASNEVKLLDVCSSSNNSDSNNHNAIDKTPITEASGSDAVGEDVKRRLQAGVPSDDEEEGEDGVGSSTSDFTNKRQKSYSPAKEIPGSSYNRPSCSSPTSNTVTSSSVHSSNVSNLTFDHSSVSSLIANVPASPPRFVAIEEVMKAANGVANMYLAHEIAVDGGFKLKKETPVKRTLKTQIEEVMKKAFWDVLESQLNESPPKYKQALSLLVEIKEDLNSLLLPQHTRLKTEIDEILDIELIKQQAENGTLDFNRYAQYVLSVMARLCAPVRDEKIRELTQTSEVVPLFRSVFSLPKIAFQSHSFLPSFYLFLHPFVLFHPFGFPLG